MFDEIVSRVLIAAAIAGVLFTGVGAGASEPGPWSAACFETTARRLHHDLVAALLERDDAPPALAAAAELLAELLARTDFGALRPADPELAGGCGCAARVRRDATGAPSWERQARRR